MSAPTPDAAIPVPIKDAATIVVLDRHATDGPSVLMGQRGKKAVFMPSKYVFPGGALDENDLSIRFSSPLTPSSLGRLQAEQRAESRATPEGLAAAALRELAEETGLLCGPSGLAPESWPEYVAGGITPDPSGLVYFFRAITPPHQPRRFDTRFFLLDTAMIHGDPRDFSRASDELSNIHWVPVAEARQLDLPFITEIVLAEIGALLKRGISGPQDDPEGVPFFDNRSTSPRFIRIG